MARIRTIKPEFFRHEGLQDLERDNPGAYVMLTFAGLWTQADRFGRFEWKPRTLKLDILPFLDFDLEKTLMLLQRFTVIRCYEVAGKRYGEIINFLTHQRISGKEATDPGKYPEPTEYIELDQKGNNREATEKQPVAQEMEGKGRERERERIKPAGKQSRINGHRADAIEVLSFLNEKAHRAYRPSNTNLRFIAARLESATVQQCKQIIAKKCREWLGNDEMAKYLRPATLFNETKFEQYIGELVIPKGEDREMS